VSINTAIDQHVIYSILVVEDDEQHRRYLTELLTSEGYAVTQAKDGVEAANILKNNHYDLLITDIVMPEKEGIELIFEVHESQPDLPIIGMSGGGKYAHSTCYLEAAKCAGASYVFDKPIYPDDLMLSISSILHVDNECD